MDSETEKEFLDQYEETLAIVMTMRVVLAALLAERDIHGRIRNICDNALKLIDAIPIEQMPKGSLGFVEKQRVALDSLISDAQDLFRAQNQDKRG